MNIINFPSQKGYIVVESQVVMNSIESFRLGKVFIRPKSDDDKNGHFREGKWITWVLEPGEWWPIGSIWYPLKLESKKYFHLPLISLNIHRSKKGRKWVKDKLTVMAMTHLGIPNFHCTERTIVCSTKDLNGRVILAPDQETAVLYNKRILEQCNITRNPNNRFSSLLLE